MDTGVEIEFADGKFVVDTPYASLIRQATDGEPERYTYKAALKKIGPLIGDQVARRHFNGVINEHLRNFGG